MISVGVIRRLAQIANDLDESGFIDEANEIDEAISSYPESNNQDDIRLKDKKISDLINIILQKLSLDGVSNDEIMSTNVFENEVQEALHGVQRKN